MANATQIPFGMTTKGQPISLLLCHSRTESASEGVCAGMASSGINSSQVGFIDSIRAIFCDRVQCLSSFSRAIALLAYW